MSRAPVGIPGSGAPAPLLKQRWHTINPAHAIQRTVAVITFPEEIPSFVVNRTVDAVRNPALAFGLVKEEQIRSVVIQVGPGGAQQTNPEAQDGVSFQQVQGNQVTQVLAITKQALRFETANYTRWVAFRKQLEQFLSVSLPILSQVTPAATISLEYTDFFYAASPGAEDVGLIIDNQSQLIAKRAFRRRDPFHTHSGWFESRPQGGQNLINVDVTVSDAAGPVGVRRAVTIRTFEAEHVANSDPRGLELMEVNSVLSGMDALHSSLKERLGHLLTREAKSMISLGG